MVATSSIVPVVVAVIGVVGAIVPIYINSIIIKDSPDVYAKIRKIDPTHFIIDVRNSGNAPATNLSVILDAFPMKILSIKNNFSPDDLILTNFNNTILEPGINKTINQSLVDIQTPKLVQGAGSSVELETYINDTSSGFEQKGIRIVYDQGSELGVRQPVTFAGYLSPLSPVFENVRALGSFYVIFYVVLIGFLYRYVRRRKRLKTQVRKIVKNVMEIRRVLLDDRTNKDIFPEGWFEIPEERRHDYHQIGDYLLIDDFHSELRKRNSHLKNSTIDENSVIELNGTCLKAAEKMLKEIDWNKYR